MANNQELIQTDAFTWLKMQGNEFTNWPPGCEGELLSAWPRETPEKQIRELVDSAYYRKTLTLPKDSDVEYLMGDIIMNVRGARVVDYNGVKCNPSLFDEGNFPYPRMNLWWQVGPVHLFYEKISPDIPVTYEAVMIINPDLSNKYKHLPGFEKDGINLIPGYPNEYRGEPYPPKKTKFAGKK